MNLVTQLVFPKSKLKTFSMQLHLFISCFVRLDKSMMKYYSYRLSLYKLKQHQHCMFHFKCQEYFLKHTHLNHGANSFLVLQEIHSISLEMASWWTKGSFWVCNERRCYYVTPPLIGWAHTTCEPINDLLKDICFKSLLKSVIQSWLNITWFTIIMMLHTAQQSQKVYQILVSLKTPWAVFVRKLTMV